MFCFLPYYYCLLEIKKYAVMAVSDSIMFIPRFLNISQYGEIFLPSFQTLFPGVLWGMCPAFVESEKPDIVVTIREVEKAERSTMWEVEEVEGRIKWQAERWILLYVYT
jgi:hypothetical protein